jgi:hypothetical protein
VTVVIVQDSDSASPVSSSPNVSGCAGCSVEIACL